MFLHADSEDSDQTGQMLRLIFVGHKGHFVGFVMRRLKLTESWTPILCYVEAGVSCMMWAEALQNQQNYVHPVKDQISLHIWPV